MADRPDRTVRDKTVVTPEPSNPALFAFLEKLFAGDDLKPDKIELKQAFGAGARKYAESTIDFKEFRPNTAKPTREDLVGLSNRFLDAAQLNCNAISKPHRYGILAKSNNKSSGYYSVFILALTPTQQAGYDPTDPNSIEDDDVVPDIKRRDGLLAWSFDHLKQGDENERWRADQHAQATGDLIEKYQALATLLMAQSTSLMQEHRELFRVADEALSRKQDRELAVENQKFKHEMIGNAFQFLKSVAPIAVNQLTGKKTMETEDSAESIGIRTFLEGLSEIQAKALFGDISPDGKLLGNGVFRPEQTEVFAGVAENKIPPSELDRFMSGGDLEVTQDQMAVIPTHLASQQFMPLVALVMTRKKPA